MFGFPLGMLGIADSTNGPPNSPEDMASLQKMLAAVHAANNTPNGRVARGFQQLNTSGPPAPTLALPPQATATLQQAPVPTPPPAPAAAPAAPTAAPSTLGGYADLINALKKPPGPVGPTSLNGNPLNNVAQGPTSTGGAPISFGPISVGGNVLGGSGATGYQGFQMTPGQGPAATGPDLMQKYMKYFANKDSTSNDD
jgi:hypothetical protein